MSLFNLIVICLACVGPFATSALPSPCRDYTLDKCSVNLDNLIEEVKITRVEVCQMYCDVVYKDRCKFFVYDKNYNLCSLLDEPIATYETSCSKFAGPKTPSYTDCAAQAASDPCSVFVDESCQLEGRPLQILEQIQNKETCQFTCFVLPACKYFLYDSELLDCELFASEERSCYIVRGPPKPPAHDCIG